MNQRNKRQKQHVCMHMPFATRVSMPPNTYNVGKSHHAKETKPMGCMHMVSARRVSMPRNNCIRKITMPRMLARCYTEKQ